ncbi:hypothetical protein NA57DRAFT_59327 [Rhizodiscina lignyota]|uniref:Zn(2)-C6 fungal-type domain-containing protein n=1 Tax=Rhizodiscina lignyota TaxID=1504668 RepID=A0A9P4IBL3_9PEZI|nr:hypothetical protein NA57DRAFT_59327 [Rhizodiscina lignyota]
MPVSRRACDRCRAHKLKCQWLEEFASCAQCRKGNKPCAMPALPSPVNRTSKPSSEGIAVTSLPMSSGLRRNALPIAAPPSGHFEDRLKRLEDFMHELKSPPPAAADSYRHPQSQNDDFGSSAPPPTAQKRTYDQISTIDETAYRDTSMFRIGADDGSSMILNDPIFGQRSSYIYSRQLPSREAASLKRDRGPSHPGSMRLKNCAKGACYLPPPDEGSALLNEYLADFNSKIPLFHPEAIYTDVRNCYSGAADKTPLSWVLTYTTLGIAHRLRAMGLFAALDDTANADWYLNRCLAVLPDLLLEQPSLPLVQALLGVSVLLQSSHRSRRAALFVSTAMHMAQVLGYNEAEADLDKASSEHRQGLYVFWIAFFMDTAMGLRTTRPNAPKLADISVPPPRASSSDWWTSNSSVDDTAEWKLNVFALHASLALIQAEASEELFSVKARHRSADLTAIVFKSIISKLEIWRQTNPLAETDATSMLHSMYQSDAVHLIILEASYFETLYQIHAASVLGAFTRRLDVFLPNELRSAAGRICFGIYVDAQRLLTLAGLVPQGNVSITWITMHALIAALCTVLAYNIRRNGDSNAIVDTLDIAANMRLYKNILESLELAVSETNDPGLTSQVNVCRHLYGQIKDDEWLSQS